MNFSLNLDTSLDFFGFFLVLCVVFVNGFTDAPNSVQSAIKSRALNSRQALILSGAFNFLGVFASSYLFFSVGKSVGTLAEFSDPKDGGVVSCACLLTVILVGVLAWALKMPSSESHALLFSLIGASAAVKKTSGFRLDDLLFIIFCMAFSSILAYVLSYTAKHLVPKCMVTRKSHLALSCSLLSFMHGAQDGQKLLAILLITVGTQAPKGATPPMIFVFLVASVMCVSTLLCDKRILGSIDKLSENSDTSSGFFADLSAFLTLLCCSALGMPVSTGNVKSASVFGGELTPSEESKKVITRIFLTSIITLPISFFLGFALCKVLLLFV